MLEQGRWLGKVMRGYHAYHAVPTNARKITSFHHFVVWHWRRALSRRSQKAAVSWTRMRLIAARWFATGQDQPSLAAIPLPRQTPKVGAECVSSARSDLSGGRRVKPASLPGWAVSLKQHVVGSGRAAGAGHGHRAHGHMCAVWVRSEGYIV